MLVVFRQVVVEFLHVRFIQCFAELLLFAQFAYALSRIRFDITASFHPAAYRGQPVQIVVSGLGCGITVDVDVLKKALQVWAVKLVYIY